jgi:hypothetical protein
MILVTASGSFSQKTGMPGKTGIKSIPDVEIPSLHEAPVVYYKPTTILLNLRDSLMEQAYWRRNFTDQFLETWSNYRMYPASRIFGFIQDSVYYRSTTNDGYHIFVPQIYRGPISVYYTRYIHNLGEIRMVSKDTLNPDYHNNMIVTGDIPQRYANEFTFFVTFPWDTLTMIPVNNKSLPRFANTYLRACPAAYEEAMKYEPSPVLPILTWTLLPVAFLGTAAFLLTEGKPFYFVAIGGGALVT